MKQNKVTSGQYEEHESRQNSLQLKSSKNQHSHYFLSIIRRAPYVELCLFSSPDPVGTPHKRGDSPSKLQRP